MSRNATVRSSSWTRSAGIVPAAMPQKMQSLIGPKDTAAAAGAAVNMRIAIASGTITLATSAQATNACDGASL